MGGCMVVVLARSNGPEPILVSTSLYSVYMNYHPEQTVPEQIVCFVVYMCGTLFYQVVHNQQKFCIFLDVVSS